MPDKPLSENGKRRVFTALAYLVHCDGDEADEERAVLEDYRQRFGLSEDEAKSLEADGKNKRGLAISANKNEQKILLDALIEVAVADGLLVEDEERRLLRIGKELGLTEEQLLKRISESMS